MAIAPAWAAGTAQPPDSAAFKTRRIWLSIGPITKDYWRDAHSH